MVKTHAAHLSLQCFTPHNNPHVPIVLYNVIFDGLLLILTNYIFIIHLYLYTESVIKLN